MTANLSLQRNMNTISKMKQTLTMEFDLKNFTNILVCSSFLCLLIILLGKYLAHGNHARQKQTQCSPHDPDVCKRILSCVALDNPEVQNQFNAVKTRALPNRRLVHAFLIDNAFTTMDDEYRRQFKYGLEQKILEFSPKEWENIAAMAQDLTRDKSRQAIDEKKELLIVPMVQLLALKISLYFLFRIKPSDLEDSVVSSLAESINALWIRSKNPASNETEIHCWQKNLQRALVQIFPGQPIAGRETPLNQILPAYETLWRVVVRCFLEVSFRNNEAAPKWCNILTLFLETPTTERFNAEHASTQSTSNLSDDYDVSVSFLVHEALRLYPPTRRVYRTFKFASNPTTQTVAADIEGCQRNPAIWGPESLKYIPGRWKNPSLATRRAFMPFGGGPFLCPAKKDFGPRMIGVLVAALATNITTKDWRLGQTADGISSHPEEPLDSKRESYGDLHLLGMYE